MCALATNHHVLYGFIIFFPFTDRIGMFVAFAFDFFCVVFSEMSRTDFLSETQPASVLIVYNHKRGTVPVTHSSSLLFGMAYYNYTMCALVVNYFLTPHLEQYW